MAFTKFKPSNITVTHGAINIQGIQSVDITENAAPVPAEEDTTSAPASSYEMTKDPLGGKGAASVSVVIRGLASKRDVTDSGMSTIAYDTAATLTIKVNGASGGDDQFTVTSCNFKGYQWGVPVTGYVPYTATFTKAVGSGTWSTQ